MKEALVFQAIALVIAIVVGVSVEAPILPALPYIYVYIKYL